MSDTPKANGKNTGPIVVAAPLGATPMDAFPESTPRYQLVLALFDGKCWKVDPGAYDYDSAEKFATFLKAAAQKSGYYLRAFVTADNHVIVQRRPADYVPARGGAHKKRVVEVAGTSLQ